MVGGAPGDARPPGPARNRPANPLSAGSVPPTGAAVDCSTWHWVQFVRWAWLILEAIRSPTFSPSPWHARQAAADRASTACGMVGGAPS